MSPAMDMKIGDNHKSFAVRMDLTDSTTIVMGFIYAMFPAPGNKARLILTAEDITVSLPLGIKITGLKMRNVLTCTGQKILDQVDIPDWVCYPKDSNHTPYSANGYYMSCVDEILSLTTTTTTPMTHTTTTTKGKSV